MHMNSIELNKKAEEDRLQPRDVRHLHGDSEERFQ